LLLSLHRLAFFAMTLLHRLYFLLLPLLHLIVLLRRRGGFAFLLVPSL
jgi:hypothetical protein